MLFTQRSRPVPVPPQDNGGRSSRPTRPEDGVAGGRGGRRKLTSTLYDIAVAEGGGQCASGGVGVGALDNETARGVVERRRGCATT